MSKLNKFNKSLKNNNTNNSVNSNSNPFDRQLLNVNKGKLKHHTINQELQSKYNNSNNKYKLKSESSIDTINKRRALLLNQFESLNKSNKFIDSRIGENNNDYSVNNNNDNDNDKGISRFKAERMKRFSGGNSSIYNIDSDSEADNGIQLTHKGQALSNINFNDNNEFDESDDANDNNKKSGSLSGDIVNDLNFGGGQNIDTDNTKSKHTKLSAAELIAKAEANSSNNQNKTKKDIMSEIIAKSKLFKAERAEQKQTQMDLINELDEEFKDIRSLMEYKNNSNFTANNQKDNSGVDEFTNEAIKLASEARAKAVNKLKSDAELAAETKEKLQQLENERLQRMKHDPNNNEQNENSNNKLISDDSLQENYLVDRETRKMRQRQQELEAEKYEQMLDHNNHNTLETEVEDNNGDISDSDADDIETNNVNNTQVKSDPNDLPFLFTCPSTHNELLSILNSYPVSTHSTIITRIRACYHLSLAIENRGKLERFLSVLIQHFHYLCNQQAKTDINNINIQQLVQQLDWLTIHINELTIQFSGRSGVICRENIIKIRNKLKTNNFMNYPSIGSLFEFQLYCQLFAVSDYRHNILTPTYLLLAEILFKTKMNDIKSIITVLFIHSLLINTIQTSKRLIPELLNSIYQLLGILFNINTNNENDDDSQSQLKLNLKQILTPKSPNLQQHKLNLKYLFYPITYNFQSSVKEYSLLIQSILYCTINNLTQLQNLYYSNKEITCFNELFTPFKQLLNNIITNNSAFLPKALIGEIDNTCMQLTKLIDNSVNKRRPLTLSLYSEPIIIKQHNPQFIEGYKPGKDYDPIKERASIRELTRKVKKEKRGALKEIRKDESILAIEKAKINEAKEKQREIVRKRVWTDLVNQAADTNLMDKVSKKKTKKGK